MNHGQLCKSIFSLRYHNLRNWEENDGIPWKKSEHDNIKNNMQGSHV